jgi:cyclic 2,3-diphosphoglycerate synthetase
VSRVVVLIDGEHYPPVVRGALAALAAEHEVLAAVFAGGTEKIGGRAEGAYGVPVIAGATVEAALAEAIRYCSADTVLDLSDEPVLAAADRFRLASVVLGLGVAYAGADFTFRPPMSELDLATPTLAIVGTGKRVGKTAVSAFIARTLTADARDVAVLAMGRGGPAEPELIRGDRVALTTADLLALAREGVHAASDGYEDAVMARVATVACRRCGGGLAGAVFFSNVAAGARLADGLGKELVILEGSGSAVPPVEADASVLVIGAAQGLEYVTGYFGPMRVRAADVVVLAGAEGPLASKEHIAAMTAAVRALSPDVPIVPVAFRPRPIAPVDGARVFFATTAPAVLVPSLAAHLEREHGCTVVGSSHHLSDRARLREDLAEAAGSYDVLVTELKAAAVDVVAEAGEAAGVPTVLADNVPFATDETDLEGVVREVAEVALLRGAARGGRT